MLISITSCYLFIDKNETASISYVSYKPIIKLKGPELMSLKKGTPYVEYGAEVTVGDTTNYPYTVKNVPNTDSAGLYIVEYIAVNGFGWQSIARRPVLVYVDTAYSPNADISGEYQSPLTIPRYKSKVTKAETPGFYIMSNFVPEGDKEIPCYLVDRGNNKTFEIVPGKDSGWGKYSGYFDYVKVSGKFRLTGKVTFVKVDPQTGVVNTSNKNYTWYKK